MSLNPTTLQSMITLLRQRTNTEISQFVTDSELTSYLNNSLSVLDGILITKYNDYKITDIMTNLVPSTDRLQLPDDFLKFRGLDILFNPNDLDGYQTVHDISFRKRNTKSYGILGNGLYSAHSIKYRILGNTIKLVPAKIAAQYNYRLWYVPDFIPLVNSTDTLQPYMDSQAWYEFAIADAAVKVQEKQDLLDSASFFQKQADALQEHITKVSAPNRNAGDPISIVDTRNDHEHGGYGWNW